MKTSDYYEYAYLYTKCTRYGVYVAYASTSVVYNRDLVPGCTGPSERGETGTDPVFDTFNDNYVSHHRITLQLGSRNGCS